MTKKLLRVLRLINELSYTDIVKARKHIEKQETLKYLILTLKREA